MGNCFDKEIVVAPRWKAQEACHQILEAITKKRFLRDGFYDWLLNPKTGHPLQLDSYNPDLGIALEYNGIQHYKYPNNFHKSDKEFLQQKHRDKLKIKLCKKRGVHLIVVPYTVKKRDLEAYIRNHMPKKLLR